MNDTFNHMDDFDTVEQAFEDALFNCGTHSDPEAYGDGIEEGKRVIEGFFRQFDRSVRGEVYDELHEKARDAEYMIVFADVRDGDTKKYKAKMKVYLALTNLLDQ